MPDLRRILQRGSSATVGVAFGTDSTVAVQLAAGDRDHPPRLIACDELPAGRGDGALAAWVERHGVARARVVGVLAHGDYRVLSIDAPPVEPAELPRAVGWHIRELIDFPLADAVIDTFDPPASAQRGRRTVYVVVARRDTVVARVEALTQAGLAVQAVDIPELAQREVSDRLGAAGGHALLALGANAGLLTVFRDGEHYLARTIEIGRTALAERGPSASAELVLELQRSIDYFESALSQPPLSSLLLFPADEVTEMLRRAVADQLRGVACSSISPGDIVAVDGPGPAGCESAALHALGAALRAGGQSLGAAA